MSLAPTGNTGSWMILAEDGEQVESVYTPATDIVKALNTARCPISHFWGTHEDHQSPSTDAGDD